MSLDSLRDRFLDRRVARDLRSYDLPGALEAIDASTSPGSGPEPSEAEPIFVLSAGWRSGSTLVQRLLCSDAETLIWGEPFGEAVPIPRLAAMTEAFLDKASRRSRDSLSVVSIDGQPLSQLWIANLNPGFGIFKQAQRRFVDALLQDPADAAGFTRWGSKWVRLTGDHARYLRWLYPRARFVFLVRNPQHAWRSYKGRGWYAVNPTDRVRGPLAFAAHWRHLVRSFLESYEELGAMLVRYEDLLADAKVRERLGEHCGVEIEPEVFAQSLRGGHPRRGAARWERAVVAAATRDERPLLGY